MRDIKEVCDVHLHCPQIMVVVGGESYIPHDLAC